jgi:hypothetical protein
MADNDPQVLKIQTFPVTYWHPDGTVKEIIRVRPVPFMGSEGRAGQIQAIEAQERIIEYVVHKSPAIGAMVVDEVGLTLLKNAAAMMWVMGEPETKRGISLANLLNAGDYTQIGQIFVSKTYSEDEIVSPIDKPSHFAEIHKMDYWGKFYREQEKRENQAIAKLAPPSPPINTPLPAAAAGT